VAADVVAPAGGAAVLPVQISSSAAAASDSAGEPGVSDPPVQAQNTTRARAQAVAAAQNFGKRKQTRDMLLQRYKELPTAISRHSHS